MHKTITTFSMIVFTHRTGRAMQLVNNDFSHKYVASSVKSGWNGSVTRKPMVEVAFGVVHTFPTMHSAVVVRCKASSHL